MKEKLSIVLPTYNESNNVVKLIKTIFEYVNPFEIIVVDDNSPDLTWKIVRELNNRKINVVRRINEKGVGSAILDGIKKSKGDLILWMDCDLGMHPKYIPAMLKEIKYYDIVIGSRYVNGGHDNRDFIRRLASYIINFLANIILEFKVLDYATGFVLAKKKFLKMFFLIQ